jgi:hypothetical protein
MEIERREITDESELRRLNALLLEGLAAYIRSCRASIEKEDAHADH